MRIPFLLLLLASLPLAVASTLERVASLELTHTKGPIEAYYAKGYGGKARATVELLQGTNAFFGRELGREIAFSIAVMDPSAWERVSRIPYGLPFVSGPPYIVCLPATTDNPLASVLAGAVAGTDLLEWFSLETDVLVDRYISFIGFHELGHIYAREAGMSFPNKWTFEFMATYLAYAYLREEQPDMARLWGTVTDAVVAELAPEIRNLARFEEQYVRVGVGPYAWYQMVFLQRVRDVYGEHGLAFVERYRSTSFPEKSDSHYLKQLDAMAPGFEAWAKSAGLR